MKSEKVAREVAEQEFERMCDLARVDTDESEMDEDEKTAWRVLKDALIKQICSGALVVDAAGQPTYAGLTFHAPTGATMMCLETYKDKNLANMAAAMCEMTRSDKGAFAKMHAKDFRVCSTIANLFLSQG